MVMKALIIAALLALLSGHVYADVVDARYCGEPKRNASGVIIRNITIRKQFESLYPLPSNYSRLDWQVDHVIPLSSGGCDSLINMQWLPKSIKTCANDNCKDRWERTVYILK